MNNIFEALDCSTPLPGLEFGVLGRLLSADCGRLIEDGAGIGDIVVDEADVLEMRGEGHRLEEEE